MRARFGFSSLIIFHFFWQVGDAAVLCFFSCLYFTHLSIYVMYCFSLAFLYVVKLHPFCIQLFLMITRYHKRD